MPTRKSKSSSGSFTTFLCPHFHCDPVWLEDQATYARILLTRTRQFLECCRADPDYAVLLSELDYLKPYWDTHVEDRDWILRLVREGRLEAGGSYNEPNVQNISGEGIIRNIIYGRGFHERVLGCSPRAYLCFDVFGHSPQLSQIARKAGFDGIVWSKHIKGAPQTFWGMALDGSVLLHRHVDYWTTPGSLEELLSVLDTSMREQTALGLRHDFRLVGTDFRPPLPYLLGRFGWLKTRRPRIVGAGPSRYFQSVLADIKRRKVRLPIMSRDISLYHAGTALSRISLKIANRLAENALHSAEKFGAIACLLGAGYPDRTLDKAWRQLLFGQHHDAITGTPCDISYLDLMAGYREALELATKALRASIAFIARRVRTGGRRRRRPVIVFNPLAWDRTDVCRIEASGDGGAVVDADGNAVPCEVVARRRGRRVVEFLARDVPAVGYKTFYVTDEECGRVRLRRTVDGPGWNATSASSAGEPRRSRGPAAIGNEFFRVEVDPARGGGIVSLVDKRTGREFMRPDGRPANDLVALREKPDRNEPSWEFFTTGEKLFASDAPAIVEVRKGPLSSRLVVTSPLGTIASRRQEIVLREGVARIDFRTEILDYREPDNLFVVIFPNNLSNLQPVFEDRFGTLTRRRSRGYLDFRTHQMHMFSGCAVYSAQHFVDLGPSFAVLAQGSAGDDARGFPLGFCATVTGGSASDREAAAALAEALVKRGVTCTPWTDAVDRSLDLQDDLPWLRTVPEWGDKDEDLLYCDFRFSVGGPDVNAYTKRLLQRAPRAAREAFAAQLSATGRALLLLLDDAPLTKDAATPRPREPLPVLIIAGKTRSETREAVDDLIRRAEAGASLTIPDECNFAGQLPALDDSGLAVLNNGNIAASVECDGTLVLHLMHTAWWSRVQGEHLALGTEFVPEHKDHVFLYSLIPHAGDFRQADLPRRGWEFNNPLIPVWREAVGLKRPGRGAHASDAVIAGPDSADLPSEKSFVRVEGEGVVLTTLKPVGNPQANFSAKPSEPHRGLIARLYETHGRPTRARVRLAFPVRKAYRSDLIERRGQACVAGDDWVELRLGPNSIETVEVVSRRPRVGAAEPLIADEREPVQPVYSRYWEHNAGAAPVDNLPVALSLDAVCSRGEVRALRVSVANDFVDATAEGTVQLKAPEGWIVTPEAIRYRLGPGEARTWQITCGPQADATDGIIRAETQHNGQTYYDVVEVAADGAEVVRPVGAEQHDGRGCCLQVAAERGRGSIRVVLHNPHRQAIACAAWVISPLETWPAADVGPYSLLEVTPRIQACVVGPGAEERLSFSVTGEPRDAKWWAVVKVAYNGRVDYKRV